MINGVSIGGTQALPYEPLDEKHMAHILIYIGIPRILFLNSWKLHK